MSKHEGPDRLNESWSRTAPRYSDKSATSAQMIRYARESGKSSGNGWFGRIICQLSFILFFFVPGGLFLTMWINSGWTPGLLGLVPAAIGGLLSYFIWKK
ncbi:MAG: hypothetical protein AAF571_00600 [Verrucomicrobiota bacterium]